MKVLKYSFIAKLIIKKQERSWDIFSMIKKIKKK